MISSVEKLKPEEDYKWKSEEQLQIDAGHPKEQTDEEIDAIMGKRVSVWWQSEEQWYYGYVVDYNKKTKRFLIDYDDGDESFEYLPISGVRIHDDELSLNVTKRKRNDNKDQKKNAKRSKKEEKEREDICMMCGGDKTNVICPQCKYYGHSYCFKPLIDLGEDWSCPCCTKQQFWARYSPFPYWPVRVNFLIKIESKLSLFSEARNQSEREEILANKGNKNDESLVMFLGDNKQ